MSETGGCDVAWTKPSPNAVTAAGMSFLLGYLSGDPSKNLSGSQIAGYLAAGIRVGLVWETAANRVLGGAAAGAADGAAAEAQANAAGYDHGAVIFFAVDFAADPSTFPAIAAYAAAFNSAVSRPVGIYGSFDVVEHFVTPGQQPVQYGWQTAAWSAGRLSSKANIYQRAAHLHWGPLAGVPDNSWDEDVLCSPLPLMGGVTTSAPSSNQPPAPAPAPIPAPAPPAPPAPARPAVTFTPDFRASQGATGPIYAALQAWAKPRYFYAQFPGGFAPIYGPATAAFLAQFCTRQGVPSDGRDIGPHTASLLWSAGFRYSGA